MPELRMNRENLQSEDRYSREEPISMAERELLAFLDTASDLVGPNSRAYLTEIWLDELACLDCMPEPSSSDWRLVSDAAARRLAMDLAQLDLIQTSAGLAGSCAAGQGRSGADVSEAKSGSGDFSCILSVSAVIY